MTKNSTAYQHSEIYDNVKRFDVNALRAFMFANTKDVIDAIDYWNKRKLSLINKTDENQLALVNMEIMRLESILLAKTELTLDFFNIANIHAVESNAEVLASSTVPSHIESSKEDSDLPFDAGQGESKPKAESRWGYKTLEGNMKVLSENKTSIDKAKEAFLKIAMGKIIDLGDGKTVTITTEAEAHKYFNTNFAYMFENNKPKEGGTVIQMVPETIKFTVLSEHCRKLIAEGKAEEAFTFAKLYLSNAKYIPNKAKQKATAWEDARITSWLQDLTKSNKLHSNIKPESSEQKQETTGTTESEPEEEVFKNISISAEHYKKFCKVLESQGHNIKEVLPDEIIKEFEEGTAEYGSIIMRVESEKVEGTLASLKEGGIDAMVVDNESEDEDTNQIPFYNKSITLTEEIEHIENLLKQCKELRGDKRGKNDKTGIAEIEELATYFFGTRPSDEYKSKKEFMKVMQDRPELLTTSKEFFSFMIPENKLTVYEVEKDNNQYRKVIDEIIKASKGTDYAEVFQPQLMKRLKHKILCGPTSDGKQIINRVYFYTSYHVLHFMDQVVESAKAEGNQDNSMGESVATAQKQSNVANASTTPANGASEKPAEKDNNSSDELKERTDKLESTILGIVKAGGIINDVLTHPSLTTMKGQKFADPWETGFLILNDENYKKFLTKKFEEISDVYMSSLTDYPDKEMKRLLEIAYGMNITPEGFVKDNIDLLKKKDGTFLAIRESGKKEDIIHPIESEADFIKYVAEYYSTLKEISDAHTKERSKYEVSEIKTYKEFETLLINKANNEKVLLSDLKKWAAEKVLGKIFPEEKDQTAPMFNTEHADYLDTYVEALTRKCYETPESRQISEKKIDDYINNNIETTTKTFVTFVNDVKKFCIDQKIDTSLKDLRAKVELVSKEKNKVMYDKYMAMRKDLTETGLISTEGTTSVFNSTTANVAVGTQKKVITPIETKNPIDELLVNVTKKSEIETALKDHRNAENQANILLALKPLVCEKKCISDMKMDEAGLNQWVAEFITNKPVEQKAKAKEEPTSLPAVVEDSNSGTFDNQMFENLANSKDKVPFKEALAKIVAKYEDSKELREAIIKAIREGKGSHVKKIAQQPLVEHHKMIKKAFERLNDSKNTENKEE